MVPQIDSITHFVAVDNFEAVYRTTNGEQVLRWEMRTKHDWNRVFFTRVNNQDIQVRSLEAFVLLQPDCVALLIPHQVNVLWNNQSIVAELVEIFTPMRNKHESLAPKVWVNLKLTIGDLSYETVKCDSFSEAIWELNELVGLETIWWLQTCHHCKFSYSAFPGPTNDRNDLKCFRDEPKAFAEVQEKGKFASTEALNSGDYFVNVFHTCAAWQQIKPPATVRSS
jgi:hypothetical protein